MNNNKMQKNTSQQLINQLSDLKGLQILAKSAEVQAYLIPLLQDKNNQWLNPLEYKDNKSFLREYNLQWAKAQVYKELLILLDEQELDKRIKQTQQNIEKDLVNYSIGK